jgi:hypothetical protein
VGCELVGRCGFDVGYCWVGEECLDVLYEVSVGRFAIGWETGYCLPGSMSMAEVWKLENSTQWLEKEKWSGGVFVGDQVYLP